MPKRINGEEQPYIPFGIFKIRLPFVHYKFEMPEFWQGLLLCATCLGAIPIMTDVFGLSFEVALTMVIINGVLYNLHVLLGDPVVPGWITPAIPLTLAYLRQFEMGPQRVQAMIALQLLIGILFIIMGSSGLAKKIINWVPNSIKAGILLGAGVAAVTGEMSVTGRFNSFPIAIGFGTLLTFYLLFAPQFKSLKKSSTILGKIGKFGMVPAMIFALIIGVIVKELPAPVIQWEIFFPRFGEMFSQVSPFSVGFPTLDMFMAALPMVAVCYIIAFGDFITSSALINEADDVRKDEVIDFNSNRSNLISGVRNIVLALVSPYPTMAGPLWAAVTAALSERYKEGREQMDSIFGGFGTFRIATMIGVALMPIVSLLRPVLPVALSLTLLVQGFVCTRLAMQLADTNEEKGIAGVMGAVLAIRGAAWGLGVGLILHFILGNMKKKQVEKIEEEELETVNS
ncbi:MAG: hypothetical protein KMY55_14385 [Dethiosulfatibacter sp.]|nr:hypothetical protein [Dethiosulfatibacter sp.]